jgi:hypothetical protein
MFPDYFAVVLINRTISLWSLNIFIW